MKTRSWRALVALLAVLLLGLVACQADDPLAGDEADGAPDAGEPAEDPEEPETDESADGSEEADESGETIVVGSADFAEQLILGNMMAQLLEHEGFDVETRFNLGSREVYFPALETGEVDVFAEYTGALTNFLSDEDIAETETEPLVEQLREELDGTGVVALEPSEAQNQDALVVTPETAEEYDLETVSDLAPVSGELVAGGPPEETERHVGLPGLEEVYGIEFADFVVLDAGGPQTVRRSRAATSTSVGCSRRRGSSASGAGWCSRRTSRSSRRRTSSPSSARRS